MADNVALGLEKIKGTKDGTMRRWGDGNRVESSKLLAMICTRRMWSTKRAGSRPAVHQGNGNAVRWGQSWKLDTGFPRGVDGTMG